MGAENRPGNGQRSALAGCIASPCIDDNIVVFRLQFQHFGPDSTIRQLDCCVSGVSARQLATPHGEVGRGLLIISVNEQHIPPL